MNKKEYLKQLNKFLAALPTEEREDTIQFYSELIDESPNEENAIANLPTPKQLASKLILEFGFNAPKDKKLPVITILLAIISAPVTVPLIFVIIMFIFVTVLFICVLMLTLGVFSLSVFVVGVTSLIATFFAFEYGFSTVLSMFGISIITIAISFLIIRFTILCTKSIFSGTKKFILKTISRRYSNER